jgi:hypothetical protein
MMAAHCKREDVAWRKFLLQSATTSLNCAGPGGLN